MVADLRQHTGQPARPVVSTRFESIRCGIRELFTGQSVVGSSTRRKMAKSSRSGGTPKATGPIRSTRPRIHRARTAPAPAPLPHTRVGWPVLRPSVHVAINSRPITPNSLQDTQRSMSLPSEVVRNPSQLFVGVDPEDQQLANMANGGHRRPARRPRRHRKKRRCAIDFSDGRVRAKFIACCVSAMLLLTVLAIYLALALSNRQESQEFHVLLILVILVTTIFFCHSLISICMVLMRAPTNEEQPRMSLIGPGGYANPPRPIRVALARDEEAAGIESEAIKNPPPAYGLWRESVRVDPNRLFWHRTRSPNTYEGGASAEITSSEAPSAPRPPSYASDDGVGYVLEAEPRYTTPGLSIPLSPHISGRDRVYSPLNN